MTILTKLTDALAAAEWAANHALELEAVGMTADSPPVTHRYEWVRHTHMPATGGRGSMYIPGAFPPRDVLRLVAGMRELIDFEIAELEFHDSMNGDGCSAEEIRAGHCSGHGRLDSSSVLTVLARMYLDEPAVQKNH